MSDKKVILEDQAELTGVQASVMEEIHNHLVKAQSLIDVITSAIEAKNTDNKLGLASELNSMVAVYDELECALNDSEEVLDALNETVAVDEKNA